MCAAHMGAVLWSTVLHAVLHAAQPLQPLHVLLMTLYPISSALTKVQKWLQVLSLMNTWMISRTVPVDGIC